MKGKQAGKSLIKYMPSGVTANDPHITCVNMRYKQVPSRLFAC